MRLALLYPNFGNPDYYVSMAVGEKIKQEHAWANRVTQMLSDIEAHAPLHSLQ